MDIKYLHLGTFEWNWENLHLMDLFLPPLQSGFDEYKTCSENVRWTEMFCAHIPGSIQYKLFIIFEWHSPNIYSLYLAAIMPYIEIPVNQRQRGSQEQSQASHKHFFTFFEREENYFLFLKMREVESDNIKDGERGINLVELMTVEQCQSLNSEINRKMENIFSCRPCGEERDWWFPRAGIVWPMWHGWGIHGSVSIEYDCYCMVWPVAVVSVVWVECGRRRGSQSRRSRDGEERCVRAGLTTGADTSTRIKPQH